MSSPPHPQLFRLHKYHTSHTCRIFLSWLHRLKSHLLGSIQQTKTWIKIDTLLFHRLSDHQDFYLDGIEVPTRRSEHIKEAYPSICSPDFFGSGILRYSEQFVQGFTLCSKNQRIVKENWLTIVSWDREYQRDLRCLKHQNLLAAKPLRTHSQRPNPYCTTSISID